MHRHAKVQPTWSFFSESKDDAIELKFSDIEEIIAGKLPPTAYLRKVWWSNETSGSHNWAHLWQQSGWRCGQVDLESEVATFHRIHRDSRQVLEDLRPNTKQTVFDLLNLAGISTEAWLIKNDGTNVANVKANPRYCFNWSFGSQREGYAICVWYEELKIEDEQLVLYDNLRELASLLQNDGLDVSNDDGRRHRALTQAIRARAVDDAIRDSYELGMPVSFILNRGKRREREELGEDASHVHFRILDTVRWYVHEYDNSTGSAKFVRGVKPAGVLSDDPQEMEESIYPDKIQMRAIKLRQGQSKFRDNLLRAYRRKCVVTGCLIVDLLEAAHIRPHAVEPNYSVTNGLLLRADIHTLFDLGLIAVNLQRRVQLSPALLNSEYKCYENRELKQPEFPSDMPNIEYLEQRFLEFKMKHFPQKIL